MLRAVDKISLNVAGGEGAGERGSGVSGYFLAAEAAGAPLLNMDIQSTGAGAPLDGATPGGPAGAGGPTDEAGFGDTGAGEGKEGTGEDWRGRDEANEGAGAAAGGRAGKGSGAADGAVEGKDIGREGGGAPGKEGAGPGKEARDERGAATGRGVGAGGPCGWDIQGGGAAAAGAGCVCQGIWGGGAAAGAGMLHWGTGAAAGAGPGAAAAAAAFRLRRPAASVSTDSAGNSPTSRMAFIAFRSDSSCCWMSWRCCAAAPDSFMSSSMPSLAWNWPSMNCRSSLALHTRNVITALGTASRMYLRATTKYATSKRLQSSVFMRSSGLTGGRIEYGTAGRWTAFSSGTL
mmetsp:Transcript_15402/g.26448  ORF Transcript_15402/g.26448 Transcript_15402/m.26448 type:complete len:347 (-) Transcript_15402:1859-2899(-)